MRRNPHRQSHRATSLRSSLPNDVLDAVGVDVADGQLVEIGREAAARLDLAARVHDQRLARPLTVILREPVAVPAAREALGPLDGGEVVPVQRDRVLRSDEQITATVAPLAANALAAAPASRKPSLPITSNPPASKKFLA